MMSEMNGFRGRDELNVDALTAKTKLIFAQGQRITVRRVRERQQVEQLRRWKAQAVERDEMKKNDSKKTMTIRRTGIWREAVTETDVPW